MLQIVAKAILLLAIFSIPTIGLGLECATSQCYLNAYDKAKPSSLPELHRINEIYENMTRTIGSTKAMRSKLLVIESNHTPWAVALSDNTIVITSGTIKAIYQTSNQDLADARAAFIIGHELSHLETDDLFHHRAFLANQNKQSAPQLFQQRPDEEIRADLRGFTYATVAGFNTSQLLLGDNDFFKTWLPNSNTPNTQTHPNNTERSRYLTEGYNTILSDAPYYRYASVLAHFGHYTEAQQLFEDFINRAETAQAYSNLGYVHLQRARDAMPTSLAYKYWIPTVLEPASGLNLERERKLFDEPLPAEALQHLFTAEQYLKQAVTLNSDLLVSHINLAAVYLYMPDKAHHAFAAIEDAKRTKLGSVPGVQEQLDSIENIIRLELNSDYETQWLTVRDTLMQLADQPTAADNLLYNFARLLDGRGLGETATHYWQRLYERLDALPTVYQTQVCFRLINPRCETKQHQAFPIPPLHATLYQDVRYPEARQHLAEEWNANNPNAKTLPGLVAQVFLNQQGDSVLALDNKIEMMIIRNVPKEYNQLSTLQARFGSPLVSLPINGGQILSYGTQWAALVENNTVTEIWISNLTDEDKTN